jgi:O-antigen/teichoic acid export membrane protein
MIGDLREKATSGLIWSAIERFGQQAVVFVVQIVLARLLAPEQFGLIAMVAVFMTLSSIVADAGFSQALVQRKEVGDKEISTVFYFNLGISCVMTLLLCLAAPFIAAFYKFEELTLILRVLSIRLVIGAFGSVQAAILSRQLLFKEIFWVTLPSTLISGIIAIVLAFNGFGVWALVGQSLVQSILQSSAFWFSSDWRPSRVFEIQCLKEMFPYGSRLALSSFLHQGFQSAYVLVIGKVFSAADLGYFQRARSLQRLPVENIQGILGRVTFPLFSKIQDDPPRMKRGMRKALQLSTLLVFPGMALLAAIAEPLVVTLIGEKWLPCVPYLQWLCVVGVLFPLHSMNVNLLLSIGRSDLLLRLEIIKKSLILINVFVTYRYGILAMIYGWGVTSAFGLLINTYYTKKFIDYSFYQQLKDLIPMICIALVVFAANYELIQVLTLSAPLTLAVTLCVGGALLLLGIRFVGASLKVEMEKILNGLPGGKLIGRLFL